MAADIYNSSVPTADIVPESALSPKSSGRYLLPAGSSYPPRALAVDWKVDIRECEGKEVVGKNITILDSFSFDATFEAGGGLYPDKSFEGQTCKGVVSLLNVETLCEPPDEQPSSEHHYVLSVVFAKGAKFFGLGASDISKGIEDSGNLSDGFSIGSNYLTFRSLETPDTADLMYDPVVDFELRLRSQGQTVNSIWCGLTSGRYVDGKFVSGYLVPFTIDPASYKSIGPGRSFKVRSLKNTMSKAEGAVDKSSVTKTSDGAVVAKAIIDGKPITIHEYSPSVVDSSSNPVSSYSLDAISRVSLYYPYSDLKVFSDYYSEGFSTFSI
ncbi:MAG: hypothetical protein LKK13_03795 [Bacilli bacterium]|nr:hypothetical protein [Bacilli bacterium]